MELEMSKTVNKGRCYLLTLPIELLNKILQETLALGLRPFLALTSTCRYLLRHSNYLITHDRSLIKKYPSVAKITHFCIDTGLGRTEKSLLDPSSANWPNWQLEGRASDDKGNTDYSSLYNGAYEFNGLLALLRRRFRICTHLYIRSKIFKLDDLYYMHNYLASCKRLKKEHPLNGDEFNFFETINLLVIQKQETYMRSRCSLEKIFHLFDNVQSIDYYAPMSDKFRQCLLESSRQTSGFKLDDSKFADINHRQGALVCLKNLIIFGLCPQSYYTWSLLQETPAKRIQLHCAILNDPESGPQIGEGSSGLVPRPPLKYHHYDSNDDANFDLTFDHNFDSNSEEKLECKENSEELLRRITNYHRDDWLIWYLKRNASYLEELTLIRCTIPKFFLKRLNELPQIRHITINFYMCTGFDRSHLSEIHSGLKVNDFTADRSCLSDNLQQRKFLNNPFSSYTKESTTCIYLDK